MSSFLFMPINSILKKGVYVSHQVGYEATLPNCFANFLCYEYFSSQYLQRYTSFASSARKKM